MIVRYGAARQQGIDNTTRVLREALTQLNGHDDITPEMRKLNTIAQQLLEKQGRMAQRGERRTEYRIERVEQRIERRRREDASWI